jgi:hypothetical protein
MTPRTDADRDVPPERDGDPIEEVRQELGGEGFGELVRYTAAGYVGGVVLGGVLDALGFQRSAVGQWLVRTLAGEGESVMEGVYALRRRLAERGASLAEAYGWGKLIGMTVPWWIDWGSRLLGVNVYGVEAFYGMTVPWWIDWGSRLLGVNVYGVEAFYIPYFYAMSDQIGGNVSGLLFLRRRDGSWRRAIPAYFRHPVMLTGLVVVLVVPAGLLAARLLGFSPSTQVLTALETMAANLCWLPPAVGWWWERGRRQP